LAIIQKKNKEESKKEPDGPAYLKKAVVGALAPPIEAEDCDEGAIGMSVSVRFT
jgi:hypothetical protein